MWRKAEDSKARTSGGSPSPEQLPDTTAQKEFLATPVAVRQGIKIKGEISGEGDFCLDGEFEGNVSLAGGTFTVGPNARVTADIQAREVIVRGELIGSLKSCERVHIWSTGKLTGNMETRGIVIEDGAELHSKVATPKAALEERARGAAAS